MISLFVRIFMVAVAAYLVGSIPTAYIMGRVLRGIDIRNYGSGNVGATNVMRVLGSAAGIATLGIDVLKGYLVVALLPAWACADSAYLPLWQILSCVAVIAGHTWMIFLRFEGGKGVAATAGAFLAMAPLASLSAIGLWGVVVALTRYVSLGSIIAGLSLPVFMLLFHKPIAYFWFSLFLAFALTLKHRGNLKRLIEGTERKIGQSEKLNR
jgi:acyl phosphate:glycerol-3-phosphate acyltransferase